RKPLSRATRMWPPSWAAVATSKAAAGISRQAVSEAATIPNGSRDSATVRNIGNATMPRITAPLRKKYSPALSRPHLRGGKGRSPSRTGVEVGEYFVICFVSAANSIGEKRFQRNRATAIISSSWFQVNVLKVDGLW